MGWALVAPQNAQVSDSSLRWLGHKRQQLRRDAGLSQEHSKEMGSPALASTLLKWQTWGPSFEMQATAAVNHAQ